MIILEKTATDGTHLQATFSPEQGMNLLSYKKGEVEVIDQSTRSSFEERFAGLGALIGPHFHRKRKQSVPVVKDESLFPHIARVKAKGIEDPFSHGIARYAPWKAEATKTQVKAVLTGKDLWNDVPLSVLEGQNFKMEINVELKPNGLFIMLSIVSDTDSLVGIHYYYALADGKGRIMSDGQLVADISPEVEIDKNFHAAPDPLKGLIELETSSYTLKTHYSCASAENSWQLYHPKGASYVCIEPISAQDPHHPNLTVSSLKIQLEIV